MTEINSETSLRKAILELEGKRAVEGEMLREQFFETFASFKPVNMIKSGLKEAFGTKNQKKQVLTKAVKLGAGLLFTVLFRRFTRIL